MKYNNKHYIQLSRDIFTDEYKTLSVNAKWLFVVLLSALNNKSHKYNILSTFCWFAAVFALFIFCFAGNFKRLSGIISGVFETNATRNATQKAPFRGLSLWGCQNSNITFVGNFKSRLFQIPDLDVVRSVLQNPVNIIVFIIDFHF